MYAGFITTRYAANWLGTHQKLNRLAYRMVVHHVSPSRFPNIGRINYFEGKNGPDALKVKSAGQNEPKHFYNPKEDAGPLPQHLLSHYYDLSRSILDCDLIRAAFEASWLAHALADGLTPAHHFPYHEHLHALFEAGKHVVRRPLDKVLIQGVNKRHKVKQNLKMWGSKGLISMHVHFEMGIAAAVLTSRFSNDVNQELLDQARQMGAIRFYKQQARMIANLNMYDRFERKGWTLPLARQVKYILLPIIVQTIAIVWVLAYEDAKQQYVKGL